MLGAAAVTALNEGVRRVYSRSPRTEKPGTEVMTDILSSALYYSIISLASGNKNGRWMLGAGIGLAAGLGAVALPEPLELDASTTNKSGKTKALTVAWYLGGALLTTALVSLLSGKSDEE